MQTYLVETAEDTDDSAKLKNYAKPAGVGDYLEGTQEEDDYNKDTEEDNEEDNKLGRRKSSRQS